MIVVSDTSSFIDISIIKRLDLLQEVFGKIYIPEAVYREIAIEGKGKVGAKAQYCSKLAQFFGISQPAVSKSISQGERFIKENKLLS